MRAPRLAQEAMRDAIDRALAARLTSTELRVFLALVRLVALWDRTTDHVANAQVVKATGLDPRHVRRALHALDAKGVIERIPGKGKTASRITFPPAVVNHHTSEPEGADSAPGDSDTRGGESCPEGGGGFGPSEGADFDTRGGAYAPASEVLPEVLPEVGECEVLVPEVVHDDRRAHVVRLLRDPSEGNIEETLGKLVILDGKYRDVDVALAALRHKYQWPREVVDAIEPSLTKKTIADHFRVPMGANDPKDAYCYRCEDTSGNVEVSPGTFSRCDHLDCYGEDVRKTPYDFVDGLR